MALNRPRIGQTRNGARRLLQQVNGKPHARSEDHEETCQKAAMPKELEDVDGEPLSSGDEQLKQPPPPKSTQSMASMLSSADDFALRKPASSSSSRKRKADVPVQAVAEPGIRLPPSKRNRPSAPVPPRRGQYEASRAAKEQLGVDKENDDAQRTPPASSTSATGIDFGLSSQTSQKGAKRTFADRKKAPKVHASKASDKRATNGSTRAGKSSRSQSRSEDDELDNVSLKSSNTDGGYTKTLADIVSLSSAPKDPELRNVPSRKKRPKKITDDASGSTPYQDAELDDLLKPTLTDHLSSLPSSSAPQEDLDTVSTYIRQLPPSFSEDTSCPLCHAPVSQDTYWSFWRNLAHTVKNQTRFCHSHRAATAHADYLAEGFPPIDWTLLPSRIKKHRMALYTILAGDSSSSSSSSPPNPYRERYTPLALTGKAAALPLTISTSTSTSSSRTSPSRAHPALALDDTSIYPGYYGPRGRRLIAESVMQLLSTEIKRSTDPVVQTSGPASFVQAVLVPEVAVRLIMEDVGVGRDEAEEVRERTFEMGCLLHEEVEDEVEVGEGEDEYEEEGNEYEGLR